MIRFTFLILILISLINGSCSSRKNKLDHKNLIPETDLIAILKDVHVADGLLNLPNILRSYSSYDSLIIYNQIIEQHGYTKELMDKTMKYYFIKNPKKLIKIYDQVLGSLSELESYLEKDALLADASEWNLWKGRSFYSVPSPDGNDEIIFDIELTRYGTYNLSFYATLFPDDQSVNPRFTAYACHPDSIETGTRNYIETINYIKDGQPHKYSVIIKVPVKTTLNIRGWLFGIENNIDDWGRHAIFNNITLIMTSAVL